MNKPARIEWYWLPHAANKAGHGWVHNGVCRFIALIEEWKIYPCVADPYRLEEKVPGQLYYWPPRHNKEDNLCLVCKRWEPPSEGQ